MSDRRPEVIEFIARITGTDPREVRLDAIALTSAQHAALEGLCRRHSIDLSLIGLEKAARGKPTSSTDEAAPANDPQRLDAPSADAQPAVGCDVQDIEEFKRCLDNADYKSSAFLSEFASNKEIAYCESQPDPLASLAGLLAAKEAIFKAGHQGPLPAIVIERDKGKPVTRGFAVSISHTTSTALAVAIRAPGPAVARRNSAVEAHSQPTAGLSPTGARLQRIAWVAYNIALVATVVWLAIIAVEPR